MQNSRFDFVAARRVLIGHISNPRSIDIHLIGIHDSGETLFKSVQVKKWAVMAVMAPGLLLLTLQFVRRAWNGLPENK